MFNYFLNKDDFLKYGIRKNFKWNVLHKMYLNEYQKVKEYYRNREYNYENNNMLVKLTKLLKRDITTDPLDYLFYLDANAEYFANQMGIVSNKATGTVMNSVVFNGKSNELYIYVDNAVDPRYMKDNWRDYESLRFIKTPICDVYYPVLFDYTLVSGGINIIEIDVKAMMLQYYYWCKDRYLKERDDKANVFIPTVVIPNMSDSLIDLALWNRYVKLTLGRPIPETRIKHPMYLIDYSKGIDDIYKNLIKENTKTSIYVTQMMMSIPTLIKEDMLDVLVLHKDYFNRQSKWVLWVSRLADIADIYKMLGKRGKRLNKSLYMSLRYAIKNLKNRDTQVLDKLDKSNRNHFKAQLNYLGKELK